MNEVEKFTSEDIGLEPGVEFTLTCHPGEEGISLANRLNEKIGPVFMDIMAAAGGDAEAQEAIIKDPEAAAKRQKALAEAMKKVYAALAGPELLSLAKALLQYTGLSRRHPKTGDMQILKLDKTGFGIYFQRNYKALVPLMQKAIEVNGFLDLDVSALVMGSETKQADTKDQSPPESEGA